MHEVSQVQVMRVEASNLSEAPPKQSYVHVRPLNSDTFVTLRKCVS